MIVENGLGAIGVLKDGKIHDDYRISYLKEHLKEENSGRQSSKCKKGQKGKCAQYMR